MASIAEVTASATTSIATITIAGTDYPMRGLNMLGIGRLQRIIDKTPLPQTALQAKVKLDQWKADGLVTDEEYLNEIREARWDEKNWPPQIVGDPRASRMVMSDPDLQAELVAGTLRIPSDQAAVLLEDINLSQFNAIIDAAFGYKADAAESAPDPKAATTADLKIAT